VASCAFWRTRNSLAAVPRRSDESGDRHWGRRRRVRILFTTIGAALHSVSAESIVAFGFERALPGGEIHRAAVSAVEGDATLRVPVVNGIPYAGWGTIEPKNQLAELPTHVVDEIKVRTVRPDRMALGDIGFIKIDVEGHELDVLAGLSELLAKCRPNLLIEIGGVQRGGSLAEVRRRLDPLGYIGLRLDDRGLLKALANDAEVRSSPNVIFLPMNGLLSDQTRSDGSI
jgi:FkbM family methyltransferase